MADSQGGAEGEIDTDTEMIIVMSGFIISHVKRCILH